ncbi:MAG TPA: hypothetical protein VF657_21275 [Actinoplanes sp.]
MADPHRPIGAGDGGGQRPDGPPGVPRWLKVGAMVVGVLILLVVIAMLTGLGGPHGPGRHTGAAAQAGVTDLFVPVVASTDQRTPAGARR